jgi:thymidylate synthase (FAD)
MHKVLDHGYVRTVNVMGSDLDVVNAARASFDKEVTELSKQDHSLISFLVKHKHDSTLRHCAMTFEVYAPLMIARQWYKHAVSSTHLDDQMGWNESSRRYITENEEFYIPNVDQWRSIPENRKQGSGEPVDDFTGAKYTTRMYKLVQNAHELYLEAMADGIAPEQARLMLPAYAMYVRWRWTASLNALLHFISLRKHSEAQSEIQAYADAVFAEVQEAFPITTTEWLAYRV